jgi:large subunit ribosomal protein L10
VTTLPKPVKIKAVEDMKQRLSASKAIVITDYRGLTVAEMTELRARLRKENVQYKVMKNRLAKIALRESGMNTMDAHLKGTTAIAFGVKDPVSPAKVLTAYAKENEKLKLLAGLMDNIVLSAAELGELSKLPSREVLLSRLLGSLQSPVQKLAIGLNQTTAKIAYAFDAIRRMKSEKEGAAAS